MVVAILRTEIVEDGVRPTAVLVGRKHEYSSALGTATPVGGSIKISGFVEDEVTHRRLAVIGSTGEGPQNLVLRLGQPETTAQKNNRRRQRNVSHNFPRKSS